MIEHGCYEAYGDWSAEERAKSSTWRELRAVRMALKSLVPKLKNERIYWFSDNHNVVRILDIGSKNPAYKRNPYTHTTRVGSSRAQRTG